MLDGEADGRLDVAFGEAARDEGGTTIDGRVPHPPCVVVGGIRGGEQAAADPGGECGHVGRAQLPYVPVQSNVGKLRHGEVQSWLDRLQRWAIAPIG